jgi:PLP dependent protein
MPIKENIKEFHHFLNSRNCRLVAVTKTRSTDEILEAYAAGQRDFGENKVQELRDKQPLLPADIRWHMIGHLQSNKVKYIAPYVHLIHSVDNLRLLLEIDRQALRCGRVIDCLLQVYIAREETKYGLSEEELYALIASDEFCQARQVRVTGLMGMATFTEDMDQVRREFRYLKGLFEDLRRHRDAPNLVMRELSMGMSGDYRVAVEEGSTLVRIGTLLFGPRHYI